MRARPFARRQTCMPRLPNALRDWQTAAFAQTLKRDIEALPAGALPLREAASHGGHVDDSAVSATVIGYAADGGWIRARVGVFFAEIIVGCSCGEDPPSLSAYGEFEVSIDRVTGEASFVPVRD